MTDTILAIFGGIIATVLAAIIAAVVAAHSLRKQGIIDTITKSRLERIENLRNSMKEFITECWEQEESGNFNEFRTRRFKAKVELYCKNDYWWGNNLRDKMEKCCSNSAGKEDYTNFINAAQVSLDWVWARAKQEAGRKPVEEKESRKELENMPKFKETTKKLD